MGNNNDNNILVISLKRKIGIYCVMHNLEIGWTFNGQVNLAWWSSSKGLQSKCMKWKYELGMVRENGEKYNETSSMVDCNSTHDLWKLHNERLCCFSFFNIWQLRKFACVCLFNTWLNDAPKPICTLWATDSITASPLFSSQQQDLFQVFYLVAKPFYTHNLTSHISFFFFLFKRAMGKVVSRKGRGNIFLCYTSV